MFDMVIYLFFSPRKKENAAINPCLAGDILVRRNLSEMLDIKSNPKLRDKG